MNYKLAEDTIEFLEHLHRGGAYANYWMLDEAKFYTDRNGQEQKCKRTEWFEVGQAPRIIRATTTEHVYFSIFPTTVRRERYQRNTNAIVAAINCLFAEFDAKAYEGGLVECEFHVAHLEPQPSVIISSGGGYHCYWLLSQPFELNADNRKGVIDLLYRWVEWVGGDEVKDLARVLRVPGTRNIKAKYAPSFPVVAFIKRDMGCLYDLGELAAYLPAKPKPVVARPQVERSTYSLGDFGG